MKLDNKQLFIAFRAKDTGCENSVLVELEEQPEFTDEKEFIEFMLKEVVTPVLHNLWTTHSENLKEIEYG